MSLPPLEYPGSDDAPSGSPVPVGKASGRGAFDRRSPFYPHTPASLSELMVVHTDQVQGNLDALDTSINPALSTECTFVISPSPVLWMEELQAFNENPARLSVWRELSLRSRQRGSSTLNGRDWAGSVLIPSGVVGFLIEKNKLKAPVRWMAMPSQALSRFIAMLHAWQTERLIYDFSGLAGEIVLNSMADMALTPHLFSAIPAHAIYIDFESLNFRDRGLMAGFFVGINADDQGQLELVMIEDRFDQVKVHSIALRGQSVHEAVHDMLSQARRDPNPEKLREAMEFVDKHLHILLSAVMMVCSSHSGSRHIEDGVSSSCGHGRWARWRIAAPFTDTITKGYARAIRLDPRHSPVLVAEWVNPPQGALANLRCSIGTREEWGNVPGMAEAYRFPSQSDRAAQGAADWSSGPDLL